MLLRRGKIFAPAGMMPSVLISSPSLISVSPEMSLGRGFATGRGLILGPRMTLRPLPSTAGGIIMESSMIKDSGQSIFGYCPSFLGSVIFPNRAVALQVSALARYTLSFAVPLRPSQLRLNERTVTESDAGDAPMPIHAPHADSIIREPAEMMFDMAPFWVMVSRTCFEPGTMWKLTLESIFLPFSAMATVIRSL